MRSVTMSMMICAPGQTLSRKKSVWYLEAHIFGSMGAVGLTKM